MLKELVLVGCLLSAGTVAMLDRAEPEGESAARSPAPGFLVMADDVVRIDSDEPDHIAALIDAVARATAMEGAHIPALPLPETDAAFDPAAEPGAHRARVSFDGELGSRFSIEAILIPGDGALLLLAAAWPDGSPADTTLLLNAIRAHYLPVTSTRGPAGVVSIFDRTG